MNSFFKKTCRYFALAAIVFFAVQTNARANHAGAIEISDQTYPIFLYTLFAIGLLLLLVVIKIWRLNRFIDQQKQQAEDFQAPLDRRKFFVLLAIFLLIGFFSVALFYFFILYGIKS